MFLGFLYLISRMKDIQRVFEYHGAEHKVVFNFESGQAGDGRERAAVRDVASALRHELSAGGHGDRDDLLRVLPFDSFLGQACLRASRCCR